MVCTLTKEVKTMPRSALPKAPKPLTSFDRELLELCEFIGQSLYKDPLVQWDFDPFRNAVESVRKMLLYAKPNVRPSFAIQLREGFFSPIHTTMWYGHIEPEVFTEVYFLAVAFIRSYPMPGSAELLVKSAKKYLSLRQNNRLRRR